ncbi:WD-REPEATS-REGION domain-containing protein [Mycena sanguinolenta]|uniref:WD-REPEATS-REGION domain-containing protein n=1 Tax=Mycena sanguinolenta TaxID=230812 RepID=A0A8H6Z169_9AGAR|nr:WD-REPEATS-REGION domain-containing protein [Mycena sanguinolenta]
MASDQLAIDVDAFEDVRPQAKRPLSPTLIVISDDEIEILEVAAKLSRTTRTPRSMSINSDIQVIGRRSPPPAFVDLVSDDEATSKPVRSSSMSKQASRAVSRVSARIERSASAASGSRSPRISSRTAPDHKPRSKDSGSTRKKTIYQGPESSIRQDTPKPTKKQRKVESEAEEEDGYEHTTILAPYDVGDILTRSDCLQPPAEVETLVEPRPTGKWHYLDISPFTPTPTWKPSGDYVWDILRELKVLPPRHKRARLDESLYMDHYAKSHQFRRAGGCIYEILQHNGRVVVCSSTAGGDDTQDATNAYNKPGTLISWCKSDPMRILDLEQGEDENLWEKHYSVLSIAYDPVNNILASSGADNLVRTWKFNENNAVEPYSVHHRPQRYQDGARIASPHQIAFKPGTSILAVGEQRLTIRDVSVEGAPRRTFDLVEEKKCRKHVTGSIAWGFGGSSPFILALSEPLVRENTKDGYHHAFDPEAHTKKPVFTFDAAEAGEELCIDPTGDTAAIVTTNDVEYFLRIYDIRNRNGMAGQTIILEPFTKGVPEVNSMMFSLDGNYLALGRVDNCTHVYDARMLERGVLYNFKHSDVRLGSSSKDEIYGVVGVKWVESRSHRLGLVTGGNDGCVRLWDPLRAPEEGVVLAQADSDVAHFTLGDRFKGEHALVVGDSDGTVYIFDDPAGI